MLELRGRTKRAVVAPEQDVTILEHALKGNVDWGFNCTRGTCARCRCYVSSGAEALSAPNDAELDRLEPEEIEQGFRLACQAKVICDGDITVVLKTYF